MKNEEQTRSFYTKTFLGNSYSFIGQKNSTNDRMNLQSFITNLFLCLSDRYQQNTLFKFNHIVCTE